MAKRKTDDAVRAKSGTAQKDEEYAEFIRHSLCVPMAQMRAMG
jgi:hypothetical protein